MAVDQQVLNAVSDIENGVDMPLECLAQYNKLVNIIFSNENPTLEDKTFCAFALRNEVAWAEKNAKRDLFTNEDIWYLAETRLNVRSFVEDEDNAKGLVETNMLVEQIFEHVKARFRETTEGTRQLISTASKFAVISPRDCEIAVDHPYGPMFAPNNKKYFTAPSARSYYDNISTH